MVVDAAHDAQPIVDAIGGRTWSRSSVRTRHNDHVTVAPELAERFDAPICFIPTTEVLWKMTHPDDRTALADGQRITLAGTECG